MSKRFVVVDHETTSSGRNGRMAKMAVTKRDARSGEINGKCCSTRSATQDPSRFMA